MSPNDDLDNRRRREDDFDDRVPSGTGGSNGAATAALVLGILSIVCGGPLLGIPALICGALGLSRSKQTGTGQGLAIAGLATGGVGCVLGIISIGLLIPAVQKVREAAARAHDSNNAKEIALALHNFNDANQGRLPGPFVVDKNGKPNRGLSWRVAILPYVEQDSIYRQFKLDEAWDSPANKTPSQMIVRQYLSTDDLPDNQTRFRAFVGPGTAFEDDTLGIPRSFPNGTSNTLLFVETADRVPWASPQDIPYQPGGPLPALGQPNHPMFLIAMADGSVRSVKKAISPQVLHALITRNGNKPLPLNWDQ
jgi:Protein of unknown function (DUF1559)/Domain of unknown function (DUF4190)